MRKHLNCLISFATLALTLASCYKDEIGKGGEGCLTVGVEMSDELTKASSSEDLLSSASVKIYYADFSGLVRSYTYADAPEKIWLPANDYRVDVAAGESVKAAPAPASWTNRSYAGSAAFTIEPGKSKTVQVTAGVVNAVTRVTFDGTIAENFDSGFSLTVGLDKDDISTQLVYDSAKSGSEGYFLIDGLDEPEFFWSFSGTLSKNGSAFVKDGVISGIGKGKAYALTLKYTVKDGIGVFDLSVDYSEEIIQDDIIFEPLSTGLAASEQYEIWAGHATVHADVDETEYTDPDAIRFAYSADGTDWTYVPAVRGSEGSYYASLTGLSPETGYAYRLVIGDEVIGDPMEFTTEAAPVVPNGSFEHISHTTSSKYYDFFDPASTDPLSRTEWWGSGNGSSKETGSANMGFVICAPDDSDYKDGSRSACLTSAWALVKFAAGNLFSGYFGGLEGTTGGKVYFGRPFTGRPTAVRVWVKYSTGKMDHVSGSPAGEKLSTSDYDIGRIQVALGKWDYRKYGGDQYCPILVNTTDVSTFVDFATDKSTIAYANLELKGASDNPHNKWVQYVIPIDYNSYSEYPTHIVISCAASKYGDYFSGCSSSKMWIDAFELLYE